MAEIKVFIPKAESDHCLDAKITHILKTAIKYLGFPGRMIYPSKGMKKPTTIFNANIFNSRARKIWFGDIEIERERDKEGLLKLSKRLGPLYILWEMDGQCLRFMPTMWYIREKAIVTVADGKITYSDEFARRVEYLARRLPELERERRKR